MFYFRDVPLDMAAEPLWLETASVLSKWGLSDGNRPDWLSDTAEWEVDWHEVLFLAVSRFWEPLLPERAALYRWRNDDHATG